MRTNVDLDDVFILDAQRLAGLRTKRDTVDAALREFIARRRQQDILSLAGKSLIARDYDVRADRTRMNKR